MIYGLKAAPWQQNSAPNRGTRRELRVQREKQLLVRLVERKSHGKRESMSLALRVVVESPEQSGHALWGPAEDRKAGAMIGKGEEKRRRAFVLRVRVSGLQL